MKAFFTYSTIILIVFALVAGCSGNSNKKTKQQTYSKGYANDQEDIDKFHEYTRGGR